jgi:thiamine-phosphate pyrophosphorylase
VNPFYVKGVNMAQTVSELARKLNHRNAKNKRLPALIFMTDMKRLPDPSALISRLPKKSALIVRHFSRREKEEIILKIKSLCQKHKVMLLVSDDFYLAIRHRLDGVHFSEKSIKKIASCGKFIQPKPGFLTTAACHSQTAIKQAERTGIDAVLLSPLFTTQSHPGGRKLNHYQRNLIFSNANIQIYGLGGITAQTARSLQNSPLVGFAGISGLL